MPFKKGDPRARLVGFHTAEIRWGFKLSPEQAANIRGLIGKEVKLRLRKKKKRKAKSLPEVKSETAIPSPPKLTKAESRAKEILENAGCQVVKGSYPDFIVLNPQTQGFVLVEIKAGRDELSDNQKATFDVLQHLNIPVRVVHVESTTDFSELLQKRDERTCYLTSKHPPF
jgi:hypothetical protein